ncbi:class I SAM-dependent methyltransferase [Rhodopila sp.]|jgi:hypothetical protein|uniref:class I SAM-dependent methyltransferase n=1 Tax=Rhodopila sp. TaxID=2480087 RepID=UPI002CF67E5B|nr:class I SAM-dependent methyltransferase [Rhodopila sp.]HVZ07547.1 class I SAM-dependent methyltransferase [Rhodopila sp.]
MLVLEKGTIWDLLDICGRNLAHRHSRHDSWLARIFRKLARQFLKANSRKAAKRNVAHHYDLSETLFRAFLDRDMQYSCAYFQEPGMSIDEAQFCARQRPFFERRGQRFRHHSAISTLDRPRIGLTWSWWEGLVGENHP